MALRTLSLCSGIGGIDLGLAEWCRTVCYVEREAFSAAVLVARMEEATLDPAPGRTFCAAVLVARIRERQLDYAPIWDDLSTFDGRPWRGRVDLVTGGYPCQPFSLAGARRGDQDPRHLWPHIRRIIAEVAPPLVFFENVPGHVSLGFETVVSDLEGMGYRVAATLLAAQDVGASHKRERLWIMAHSGQQQQQQGLAASKSDQPLSNLDSERCRGQTSLAGGSAHERTPWPPGPSDVDGWALVPEDSQPAVRRVADGLSPELESALAFRQDRLRALGNAVVPACAAAAFRILLGELFR